MKSIQINKLYKAVGFAEPSERRKCIEYVEKFKQTFNERDILYGQEQQRKRLKSRKSFLQCAILEPPDNYPINESPCVASNLVYKTCTIHEMWIANDKVIDVVHYSVEKL
ncbi:hypothetical protein Trydic_g19163 [Trypoxylus dichotomus]